MFVDILPHFLFFTFRAQLPLPLFINLDEHECLIVRPLCCPFRVRLGLAWCDELHGSSGGASRDSSGATGGASGAGGGACAVDGGASAAIFRFFLLGDFVAPIGLRGDNRGDNDSANFFLDLMVFLGLIRNRLGSGDDGGDDS